MTSAQADSERCLALKRKAEGDPNDSGVEDSVMNSLAEMWREDTDPDSEIDLLIFQQRDRYVASVHDTGTDKLVCEEPKTPFPYDKFGWDHIDDTSGKLLGTLSTDPVVRSRLVRNGLTSTRVMKTNHSTAVEWSCKNTNVKLTGQFFTATLPLEALRSLC